MISNRDRAMGMDPRIAIASPGTVPPYETGEIYNTDLQSPGALFALRAIYIDRRGRPLNKWVAAAEDKAIG